jgi:hypothetical protein
MAMASPGAARAMAREADAIVCLEVPAKDFFTGAGRRRGRGNLAEKKKRKFQPAASAAAAPTLQLLVLLQLGVEVQLHFSLRIPARHC